MPSLSLNVGLNNGRKLPFGGGAAPSGIPVASTSQIIVVSTNIFVSSGAFNKVNETRFDSGVNGDNALEYIGGAWNFLFSESPVAFATNPAGYIPTSGYTIIDGGGSFTITAA
jgi:hypothetical protein